MAEKLLTLMPCPKCGHDAPKLTQTFTYYENFNDDCKHECRCIVWRKGYPAYKRESCDCATHKYSVWKSRTITHYNKKCKQCNGTGNKLTPETVPVVPDTLAVTCPACLYTRKEQPLDAQKD